MACLNCGKELGPSENYCSKCGQNTSTTRMSTQHAVHQFFHAFTHTDKGFFYLIPQLLTKPGVIAREYNDGKRKTYFSPFTFLLLILAVSALLVAYNNFMDIPNPANQPRQVKVVMNFINKHFNVVVLVGIPFIAYFTSLFFKNKFNFAESLVLVCYTSGLRSIFFSILVVPLGVFFKDYWTVVVYSYLMLFLLYYSWACCQYLNDFRLWNWIKAALTIVLTQIVISILIGIAITIMFAIEQ